MARNWKRELWLDALSGEPGDHRWASLPAIGQLTLNRPELLRAFERHNRERPEQAVRPFNFVSVAYAMPLTRAELPRLIAPFVAPTAALDSAWFDLKANREVRITVEHPRGPILAGVAAVRSYGEVAREHVLRPELKFDAPAGGGCIRTTVGPLRRRFVKVLWYEHLGKEGNLLERRAEGTNQIAELQQLYEDPETFVQEVVPLLCQIPDKELAAVAGVSRRTVREILAGRCFPRIELRRRLTLMTVREDRSRQIDDTDLLC